MWPRSVLWTKRGHFPYLPDAVVSPETGEEVARLLKWASQNRISVVPYGAGSGVCAGTLPLQGGLVLNMKRMADLIRIDPESLVAELQPGIYGEILERRLNPLGYTMGHFPSSIYCSTLGGYLASRSAGQMSSRYGKIEDMIAGLEFALPDGRLYRTPATPLGASRIDWKQIILGSEGTLGVITRAWMRIHPLPEHRTFLSYHFGGLREGLDTMRRIMQAGLFPSVLRLYDEFDTIVAGTHGPSDDEPERERSWSAGWQQALVDTVSFLKKQSLARVLKRPLWLNRAIDQLPGKCLLVILTEGEHDLAEYEADRIHSICRAAKGKDAGEGPARYWLAHRYAVSYKQSKIFDAGAWVDTMEVATTWREMESLYRAVKKAVAPDAFIMAHFSHAYRDGCCIYFSFAAAHSDPAALEKSHDRVWAHALTAVHRYRGTITHHHGVGMSKGAMLPVEFGQLWPLWRKVKESFDPNQVMNPGKLGNRA